MNVEIGEVHTDVTVTEGVGSLGPDELKRIVTLVMEQMRMLQDRQAERQRDTDVSRRVFTGAV